MDGKTSKYITWGNRFVDDLDGDAIDRSKVGSLFCSAELPLPKHLELVH